MGEFDNRIPDEYFDYVFSISVIEHIPVAKLSGLFRDCARVLNKTGLLLHAIDVYLFDESDWDLPYARNSRLRIDEYLKVNELTGIGLRFREPPVMDKNVSFSCSYATNPDSAMHLWNRVVPRLKDIRANAQVVSLKSEWIKCIASGYPERK